MQQGDTLFDLGKKAFSFPIAPDKDGLLFGICNASESKIRLTLAYKQIRPGSNESVSPVFTLDSYEIRSAKFRNNGAEFNENEARRYLKSRFRDLIREINAQGDANGSRKNDLIMHKAEEFQRLHRSINDTTSE
jgi:hypothetical protein